MNKFSFDPESTTVAEYMYYWYYTFSYGGIRTSTKRDYKNNIKNHINPCIGDMLLSECKTDILQEFFNDMREHGNLKTGGELSVKTLQNIKGMMYTAFNKAVVLEYISRNYIDGVDLPTMIKKEIHVFTPQEERSIKTHSLYDDNLDYGFAYWLGATFGLRNGEICALKWTDFDFDRMELHIRRAIKREVSADANAQHNTYLTIGAPKTEKSNRTIPFNDSTRDKILSIRHKRLSSNYYGKRYAKDKFKDFVFLNDNGSYANTSAVYRNFMTFLHSIGIDNTNYTMHTLRHTFATRGIEKGVDIKTLSELLGHTSVQFTLDTYTHVLDNQKRKVMNILLSDDTESSQK